MSTGVSVAADGEAGQGHVVTGHGVLEDGRHYLRPHPTRHGHRVLLLDGAGSTVMTITISITSEQGYHEQLLLSVGAPCPCLLLVQLWVQTQEVETWSRISAVEHLSCGHKLAFPGTVDHLKSVLATYQHDALWRGPAAVVGPLLGQGVGELPVASTGQQQLCSLQPLRLSHSRQVSYNSAFSL